MPRSVAIQSTLEKAWRVWIPGEGRASGGKAHLQRAQATDTGVTSATTIRATLNSVLLDVLDSKTLSLEFSGDLCSARRCLGEPKIGGS